MSEKQCMQVLEHEPAVQGFRRDCSICHIIIIQEIQTWKQDCLKKGLYIDAE